MRLTREQIERIASATRESSNGAVFYLDEGEGGRLLFGAVEVVEKKKPIGLGPKPSSEGKVTA